MTDALSCPHVTTCPGCPLHGLTYAAQLDAKRSRVERAFELFSELRAHPVETTRPAVPILGYRQRAKLVVDGDRVGLYAHGEHTVVDTPNCRVLEPRIFEVAQALRRALPLSVHVYAVDLRSIDEGVLATLVVDDGAKRDAVEREVERLSGLLPHCTGIATSRRSRQSPQLLGRDLVAVYGPPRFRRAAFEGGPYTYVGHGAFAQAHVSQERALMDAVIDAAGGSSGLDGARVLELFAGSGALSLELASRGARVTAVEAFAPAADNLRDAAREQRAAVDVLSADAEVATRRLHDQKERFDLVIANPPRRGLTPELRVLLASLMPTRVAYVSCCPETLARDLSHLSRLGLVKARLVPYDMMPWTSQVEVLAELTAGAPPPVDVLYEDDRLVAVSKPPHLPTTPQGEHQSSLLARLRERSGMGEAVPVHRLDGGTSGACLFARAPRHVEAIARALTNGTKRYAVLARGVTRPKGSVSRPLRLQGELLAARTRYRRTEVRGGHSLLEVLPDQGRKHQIRRHLASLGHPVIGDERYGDAASNEYFFKRHGLDRAYVHCEQIVLEGPDLRVEIVAPLAPDLRLVLESLATAPEPGFS